LRNTALESLAMANEKDFDAVQNNIALQLLFLPILESISPTFNK